MNFTVSKVLLLALGLTVSNVLWQMYGPTAAHDIAVAWERSFFQCLALLLAYVMFGQ